MQYYSARQFDDLPMVAGRRLSITHMMFHYAQSVAFSDDRLKEISRMKEVFVSVLIIPFRRSRLERKYQYNLSLFFSHIILIRLN